MLGIGFRLLAFAALVCLVLWLIGSGVSHLTRAASGRGVRVATAVRSGGMRSTAYIFLVCLFVYVAFLGGA